MLGDIGRGAFAAVGTVTLIGFNLAIALFVLYFMLVTGEGSWLAIRPYIPFSAASAELLRERFRAVTISTVVGTGLTATIQGILVAIAFMVHRAAQRRVLGGGDGGLRHPPGGGQRDDLDSRRRGAPGRRIGRAGARDGWPSAPSSSATSTTSSARSSSAAGPRPIRSSPSSAPSPGCGTSASSGILIGPLALSYFFELVRMYNTEYVDLKGDDPSAAAPRVSASERPATLQLVLAWAAVYFIWGSTYLGIRLAIDSIPPLLMAGSRHLLAGLVLFTWSWSRQRLPVPGRRTGSGPASSAC